MLCYRDKTYCDGAGCQKFQTCPRAATREVIEGADRSGLMLARYAEPEKLSCYVPPDGSEFDCENA
jgi:hypothetical protein